MKTKFAYVYRDACNFKIFYEVVLEGEMKFSDIVNFLKDRIFFIPSEVGLKDLQKLPLTTNDHIWHEIDSISTTTESPTVHIDTQLLIDRFQYANENDWNEYKVFERLGIL